MRYKFVPLFLILSFLFVISASAQEVTILKNLPKSSYQRVGKSIIRKNIVCLKLSRGSFKPGVVSRRTINGSRVKLWESYRTLRKRYRLNSFFQIIRKEERRYKKVCLNIKPAVESVPTIAVVPTNSPTASALPTTIATITPIPLATATVEPSPTSVLTPVPTVSATSTPILTSTPTATSTPLIIPTSTATPTRTPTPTATATRTPTPTATISPAPTSTPAHLLHAVINANSYAVDYDGNGQENFRLDGSGSHTHQTGHNVALLRWYENGVQIGTGEILNRSFAVGTHTVTLEILDDNNPPDSLTTTKTFSINPINNVPGVEVSYYVPQSATILQIIDSLPSEKDFVEFTPNLEVLFQNGKIGGSPFSSNAVIVLKGKLTIAEANPYTFIREGGVANRVFVDGQSFTGQLSLTAGVHTIEARFAVSTTQELPVRIRIQKGNNPAQDILSTDLYHDETSLKPFITSMPATGNAAGGESVTINGLGFFPSAQVSVSWGNSTIASNFLQVSPNAITLTSPPGTGQINVKVNTPNGVSNQRTFQYNGNIPIQFETPTSVASLTNPATYTDYPTQLTWGPDGRLYVGTIYGRILAYTFDDNDNVVATQEIGTFQGLSNNTILGLAFNPLDPPNPPKLYVTHNRLFASFSSNCASNPTVNPTGPLGYTGEISTVQGPNFSTRQSLITGLPVSNHDHGISGIMFDDYGDLLITSGGNTNAGVSSCLMGNIPESPLSGVILKADTSRAPFDGTVTYRDFNTGLLSTDERFGDTVNQEGGKSVKPYSYGLRNPFDLFWSSKGRLFATDNGPNPGYGAASLSATTQGPDPEFYDEFNLLIQDAYYGHPNRNRGRFDLRQNVYRNPLTTPILGNYSAPIAASPPIPSTNGIEEYRSLAFNGQMYGDLLLKRLGGTEDIYRVKLTPNSRTLSSFTILTQVDGLDIVMGPGGTIFSTDHYGSTIKRMRAVDNSTSAAFDITPLRGRADGTVPFVIGGKGFGGNTTVVIGNKTATLTSVSPTRIKGLIPAEVSPTAQLLDVKVTSNGVLTTIPKAFRYVFPKGQGKGIWETEQAMPINLGEVAGGAINGVIYLVGEGSNSTCAYDTPADTWNCNLPSRPFPGNHHAAEVINNKLYLFGGIGGSSEDKVQVYDPVTNSWSQKASIPNGGSGSASSALINGIVYYCGGIQGAGTIANCYKYDPTANTWQSFMQMPLPRNHAASGTDGNKFYIFGGRGPGSGDGNTLAEGFDDVQIYNPLNNSWQSTADFGSPIPPLPQKRGGMGKAAYFRDQFYIIGGETNNGSVPNGTYDRVDVFDPVTLTWRLDTPMTTARHGIFPIVFNSRIYVAGGGTLSGNSQSNLLEEFRQ